MEIFEPRNTVQFTVTTSTSPNSNPALTIHGINSTAVVNSLSVQQSNSTHHYAFVTMPNTEGVYVGEWYMEKTLNSSAYQFIKRFSFRLSETERGQGEP